MASAKRSTRAPPGRHRVEVVLHERGAFGIGVFDKIKTEMSEPFTGATCEVEVPADGQVAVVYRSGGVAGVTRFELVPDSR